MSAIFDREQPRCIICRNAEDQAALGKFLSADGELVDAHLKCADREKLAAVDAWAESGV